MMASIWLLGLAMAVYPYEIRFVTSESLVPEPNCFKFEIATKKLKMYKFINFQEN
jgi:hypothetical protein